MLKHALLVCVCAAVGCSEPAKPTESREPVKPAAESSKPDEVVYKALGNEPFWHVDVRAKELQLFEMADLRAVAPAYTVEERADGREYKSAELRLTIQYKECSDGMSDRKYPHSAVVHFAKGSFKGCGWPAGYDLGPPP